MTGKSLGEYWITDYFTMVDRLDPQETVTWYTDDASFRFSNRPAAKGKKAIADALAEFYSLIRSMHHEKTGCWVDHNSGAWEAIAHFDTNDGRKLLLPTVSTLRTRDGLIYDFRFVMDATPILRGEG